MSRKVKPLKSVYSRKTIPMIVQKKEKVGNRWVVTDERIDMLSRKQFEKHFTGKELKNHKRFMRNLGGKESEQYSYTRFGYIPVKFKSTSPTGETIITRKVDVKKYERNWDRQSKLFDKSYQNRLKKGISREVI